MSLTTGSANDVQENLLDKPAIIFAISFSDTSGLEITHFTFKAFCCVWLIQQSLMVLGLLLLQEMKRLSQCFVQSSLSFPFFSLWLS